MLSRTNNASERGAAMRHVHRIKREAEQEVTNGFGTGSALECGAIPGSCRAVCGNRRRSGPSDVRTLYDTLERDWNQLVERAGEAVVPSIQSAQLLRGTSETAQMSFEPGQQTSPGLGILAFGRS